MSIFKYELSGLKWPETKIKKTKTLSLTITPTSIHIPQSSILNPQSSILNPRFLVFLVWNYPFCTTHASRLGQFFLSLFFFTKRLDGCTFKTKTTVQWPTEPGYLLQHSYKFLFESPPQSTPQTQQRNPQLAFGPHFGTAWTPQNQVQVLL